MNSTFEVGQAHVAQKLSHHGVLGMKWGHRLSREAPSVRVPEAKSVVPRYGKTKIQTKGGDNHPAHDDAVHVALARQKLKKSGPHALSNKELQDVATRMNLEQQVRSLESKRPKSVGEDFVSKQLNEAQTHPIETVKKVQEAHKSVKRIHREFNRLRAA
jgi:hypothetical protein